MVGLRNIPLIDYIHFNYYAIVDRHKYSIRIKMNFSTGCDDAVREAITQSGINNGASTHICVRKTDIDEEI